MAVEREIDQNFNIPEGLQGVSPRLLVEDEPAVDGDAALVDIQYETAEDEYSELDEEEISDDIQPPDSIQVISQTVRAAPDGRQVVDVIIEVEDVPGGINYNVRITKENEE